MAVTTFSMIKTIHNVKFNYDKHCIGHGQIGSYGAHWYKDKIRSQGYEDQSCCQSKKSGSMTNPRGHRMVESSRGEPASTFKNLAQLDDRAGASFSKKGLGEVCLFWTFFCHNFWAKLIVLSFYGPFW